MSINFLNQSYIESEKWKIVIDEQSEAFGLRKQLDSIYAHRTITAISEESKHIQRDIEDGYASMNNYAICKIGEGLPYSTEFKPCIGILAKAYQKQNDGNLELKHLGCFHWFTDLSKERFPTFLSQLIEKTHEGTINFFLSGGIKHRSEKNYLRIQEFIQQFSSDAVQMHIRDDSFAIAPSKSGYLEIGGMVHEISCGIRYIGFNENFDAVQHIMARPAAKISTEQLKDFEIDWYE